MTIKWKFWQRRPESWAMREFRERLGWRYLPEAHKEQMKARLQRLEELEKQGDLEAALQHLNRIYVAAVSLQAERFDKFDLGLWTRAIEKYCDFAISTAAEAEVDAFENAEDCLIKEPRLN